MKLKLSEWTGAGLPPLMAKRVAVLFLLLAVCFPGTGNAADTALQAAASGNIKPSSVGGHPLNFTVTPTVNGVAIGGGGGAWGSITGTLSSQTDLSTALGLKLTTPSQTGNGGKFLTTDGSAASWAVNPFTSWAYDSSLLTGVLPNEADPLFTAWAYDANSLINVVDLSSQIDASQLGGSMLPALDASALYNWNLSGHAVSELANDLNFLAADGDGSALLFGGQAYYTSEFGALLDLSSNPTITAGQLTGVYAALNGSSIDLANNVSYDAANLNADNLIFTGSDGALAKFDAGGNITDSGYFPSDFLITGAAFTYDNMSGELIFNGSDYINSTNGAASFASGQVTIQPSGYIHANVTTWVGGITLDEFFTEIGVDGTTIEIQDDLYIGGTNTTYSLITAAIAPAATDPGVAGQMIFTDTYTYRCFASGDWRRAAVVYVGGY